MREQVYEMLCLYYAQTAFWEAALRRSRWFGVEQIVNFGFGTDACTDEGLFLVHREYWKEELLQQDFGRNKKTLFNLLGVKADAALLRDVAALFTEGSEMVFDTKLRESEVETVFHNAGALVYEYVDDRVMTRQYLKNAVTAPKGVGCCVAVRHR